jgi:hypothetical protein
MRDRTPSKKQKESYSGKQKHHTIKDQIIINGQTGEIICVHETKGAVHDLELFRQSEVRLSPNILLIADKGYQGICKLHAYSLTPFKATNKRPLTDLEKQFNITLSGYRILVEHVNRCVKCFKIFQYRYRNKQRKHLLRMSLICGICNYELGF